MLLTDGQFAGLQALHDGPCLIGNRMNRLGEINVRTADSLIRFGFAERLDTLIGTTVVITAAGEQQLSETLDHRSRHLARATPRLVKRAQQQPLGALCQHCHYHPARPNAKYPHLATNYCSDRCKVADSHARRDQMTHALANEIREMLGMPTRQSRHFTNPELRTMRGRLQLLGVKRRSRKQRSDAGSAQKRKAG